MLLVLKMFKMRGRLKSRLKVIVASVRQRAGALKSGNPHHSACPLRMGPFRRIDFAQSTGSVV